MPTYRAKVGAGGVVALPPELVEKLNIREDAEVEFFVTLAGEVFFHAITGKAEGWKGLFPVERRSPPISIREMDEAVGEALVEDDERIRGQRASATPPPAADATPWGFVAG